MPEPDIILGLFFRIVFVAVLMAALLVLAEVGLRFFGPNLGSIRDLVETTTDARPYVLRPNTTIHFKGLHKPLISPVTWFTNSQGIRSDHYISPYSEKFRVAIYGDSEAYGWSVDFDDTLQRQMEIIDNRVEVINFGVPGYNVTNVADHIEQTALHFHPDLIIYLVNKNDFDDQLEAGETVVNSSLLRLVKFAYYMTIDRPRQKKLRDSPARIERFASQIDRMTRFCHGHNIPLVLAFLKWGNREALIATESKSKAAPGVVLSEKKWGLARHLNVHPIIDNVYKEDRHFTKVTYREIAEFLCNKISGGQDDRCVPSSWQPGKRLQNQ